MLILVCPQDAVTRTGKFLVGKRPGCVRPLHALIVCPLLCFALGCLGASILTCTIRTLHNDKAWSRVILDTLVVQHLCVTFKTCCHCLAVQLLDWLAALSSVAGLMARLLAGSA